MFKLKKVAGCVGAALAFTYAGQAAAVIGTPGALGDAFLHFTDFAFKFGDGALGSGGAGGGPLSGLPVGAGVGLGLLTISSTGFETATTAASLNGAPGTKCGAQFAAGAPCPAGTGPGNADLSYPLGTGFTAATVVGGGFSPLGPETPVTAGTPALTSGGGGYSKSVGNSTVGPADVFIHSLSQLSGGGETNASADQDLQTEFGVTVGAGTGLLFELSFDLERLVRAGLGQSQTKAFASTLFSVTVTDTTTGTLIYNWAPNGLFIPGTAIGDTSGSCVGIVGTCVTYADPFSMQDSRTVNGVVDDRAAGNPAGFFAATTQVGYFESELFLPPGSYTFAISGSATSNASIIPEPGSIALLGLGLLGLGVASRRRYAA